MTELRSKVPRSWIDGIDLFLISFVGLFFEVQIVRWLAVEVRIFAYFKNLVLLAAFLGLGLGFTLARRSENLFRMFPLLTAIFCTVVLAVGRYLSPHYLVYPGSAEEFLWYTADLPTWVALIVFNGIMLLFFLFTLLLFVPLGQLTARHMQKFEPLPAYTINIAGSLAGTWAYAGLAFARLPPAAWFGLGLAICVWLLRESRRDAVLVAAVAFLTVGGLVAARGETYWSPYHRLDLETSKTLQPATGETVVTGYVLNVNQVGYMWALNLDDGFVATYGPTDPFLFNAWASYRLPYQFVRPKSVLVVGAGMGNDVAVALAQGAEHVDAVEIDPVILDLGRELHPLHPYRSSRVNPILDDARSFFEKSDEHYDLIVFGLLDSHTLLSAMSSVRLDNFVYTLESLEQARNHLNEGGAISLTFAVQRTWIKQRLSDMLTEVFGASPAVFVSPNGSNTIYLAGIAVDDEQVAAACARLRCSAQQAPSYDSVPAATDDWPYLYLRDRRIPSAYWQTLILLALICGAIVWRTLPDGARPDGHFFFLGSGFLLVEFKSITELALLFGSTWIVNALAISGVLVMIIGANLLVSRWPSFDRRWAYGLLFVTLALNLLVPVRVLIPQAPFLRGLIATGLLTLPLFFAGLIFATSLKRTADLPLAFGSNLLGAFVGGLAEYGSLAGGIRSLYALAGMFYVLSWVALYWRKGTVTMREIRRIGS
jgi:hypothetical protein